MLNIYGNIMDVRLDYHEKFGRPMFQRQFSSEIVAKVRRILSVDLANTTELDIVFEMTGFWD